MQTETVRQTETDTEKVDRYRERQIQRERNILTDGGEGGRETEGVWGHNPSVSGRTGLVFFHFIKNADLLSVSPSPVPSIFHPNCHRPIFISSSSVRPSIRPASYRSLSPSLSLGF